MFHWFKQIDLETALNYELALIPTALVQDNREMRDPKEKSVLKTTLEVTVSGRIWQDQPALIIDGSEIFWTTYWQNQGSVTDLGESVRKYIENKLIF